MADTVSNQKDDEEYAEMIDPADSDAFNYKVARMAELVKAHSGNVVFFTGAGISTSAGIPDFRSGLNSVTGLPAGKWCQKATASQWTAGESQQFKERAAKTIDTAKAIPTQSHMAIVALQQAGICKGLISQNCDGLHRRSGFEVESLAELHGNSNLVCTPILL